MNPRIALDGNNLSSTICKIIISDLKALEKSIALSKALSDISEPSCGTRILGVVVLLTNLILNDVYFYIIAILNDKLWNAMH